MKSFKERRHEKLNEKALDQAIKNIIGKYGEYNYNIGRIDFFVNRNVFEIFSQYDVKLPSWEDVKKEAIKIYKDFDDKGIKKIIYRFESIEHKMQLTISAPNSDLYFNDCYLNYLNVLEADEVTLYRVKSACIEKNEINAKKIKVDLCNLLSAKDLNFLAEQVISIKNSRIFNPMNNSELNSNIIVFCDSNIESKNININSERTNSICSKLKAKEKINIYNEMRNKIGNVEADTIIYNGVNITNNEELLKPKLRKQLISVLKEIRGNTVSKIDHDIKLYKEDLNNTPISKVLKK